MTARFITFEGGEGGGKTTQVRLLAEACERAGIACLHTREPGGGPGADAIRALLLTGADEAWHPVSELLLFLAARNEHVERVIRPALVKGHTVLCDRFMDSTLVYQGMARGLGEEYVSRLHHLALGEMKPDLTLLLDVPPDMGLARTMEREGVETRFEALDAGFHARVREGFLTLAKREPGRFAVIDASAMPGAVHRAVLSAVNARLGWTLA